MNDAEANKALVQQLWDALYERHDFDEVGSLFAADGFYCDMPHPDRGATGPAEIAARLRLGLAKLSGHDHDIERLVADGDTVVTEHVEHWHFPTGEHISLPFVSVHRVRDGRITLWRDYWNWDSLMAGVPQWWLDDLAAGYR
jgi:limonene-1,2-epoxide hydrolase